MIVSGIGMVPHKLHKNTVSERSKFLEKLLLKIFENPGFICLRSPHTIALGDHL